MQNIFSNPVGSIWLITTNVFFGIILLVVGIKVIKNILVPRGYRRALIWCLIVTLLSFVGWQLYVLYYFKNSPIGQYYLPPHSQYYYQQMGSQMSSLVSGIIASAIILTLGLLLVRKQKVSQFGADDWMLLSIGTLAVGWPGVLPFLAFVITFSILGLIIQILLKKKTLSDRLIITPYIMPAAILTLAAKAQILALTHLDKIRF